MKPLIKIAVIGAGGLARETHWLLRDLNRVSPQYQFVGYLVSDLSKLGEHDSKGEVLGDLSWLKKDRVDALAIGIGTPAVRLSISQELQASFPDLEWPALIHPTAQFDRESSHVSEGAIICAGNIGTVNLRFEPFCFVNLACTIGHEAVIGRGSVLNPTVNVSGGVLVESGVLVGTGAQILQYVHVGANATVGAGAVVTKDVEAGVTVVGIPAKPLAAKVGR